MTEGGIHGTRLTAREALLFEAGIKLGGIFHQYLGIPVAARTAAGLARAIEDAVRLQPYVESVVVRVDPERGGPMGSGRFAYRYLTAEMLSARVRLRDGPIRVDARLAFEPALRYPLMRIDAASATHAGRSARTAGRPARRISRSAGSV
ncbi:protein containing DUF372, partial [mine drainage metagenome]